MLGKKTVQKKATSGAKKTKDVTTVPVTKKAKTSANVQKTFPGSSKAPKSGK